MTAEKDDEIMEKLKIKFPHGETNMFIIAKEAIRLAREACETPIICKDCDEVVAVKQEIEKFAREAEYKLHHPDSVELVCESCKRDVDEIREAERQESEIKWSEQFAELRHELLVAEKQACQQALQEVKEILDRTTYMKAENAKDSRGKMYGELMISGQAWKKIISELKQKISEELK